MQDATVHKFARQIGRHQITGKTAHSFIADNIDTDQEHETSSKALMDKLEAELEDAMAMAAEAALKQRIGISIRQSFRIGSKELLMAHASGRAIAVSIHTAEAQERRRLWDEIVLQAELEAGPAGPSLEKLVEVATRMQQAKSDESMEPYGNIT